MTACVRTLHKARVLPSYGFARRFVISELERNLCFHGEKTCPRILNARSFHFVKQSTNECSIRVCNPVLISRRFESSGNSYNKWMRENQKFESFFDEENNDFENSRAKKFNRYSHKPSEDEQYGTVFDEADEYFSDSNSRSNKKKRFDNYPDDSEGDYSFDKEKDNSLYARSKKDFSRNWSDRGNSYNKKDYGGIFRGREKSYGRDYELPLDRNFDHDFYNTKKTDFSTEQPIEKNFYEEHPDVTNRPQDEIQAFLDSNEVIIKGSEGKRPIFHIKEAGFPDDINQYMEKEMDFQSPTLIQSVGWPNVLSGSDVIGIAQTGSGKTLTFLLPAVLHIHAQREKYKGKGRGPFVLVVCPTRELAIQCHSVMNKLYKVCRIKCVAVFGGAPKPKQESLLYAPNVEMVVATPGRLIDFMNMGSINLGRCTYLVLDEADRMLDMGFEPQIRAIMNQIRPDRQLLLWSATWPLEIQDLARDFVKDHIHIKIGSEEHTVNKDIIHEFESCLYGGKMDMLLDHLQSHRSTEDSDKPSKTLIFSSTKANCDRIVYMLSRNGIRASAIHGDKSQNKRDSALRAFRDGYCNVLVASDVAARGLDVSDIEYVINFDLPPNIESYIHRAGRTGRAGKKGVAMSYITDEDLNMVPLLVKLLKEVGQNIPECLVTLDQERRNMSQSRKKRKPNNFKRRFSRF